MRKSHSLLAFVAVIILAAVPAVSYAQSVTEQSRKDSISISTSPKYPEPGEEVTFSLSSYLVYLPGAQIQWIINNEVVADGPGKTKINYIMPDPSNSVDIIVRIKPPGKSIITKNFSIRPATIDLVWEANTFTPPFYEGKSLYTGSDTVKVTAIPFIPKQNGEQYNKNNLVYEWSYNGLVHGSDSGLGESSFPVDVNQTNNSVSVVISNRSGNTVGEASVSIPTREPQLIFYENKTQGFRFSDILASEETTVDQSSNVLAYPFYYPANSTQSESLTYQWYIDNESLSDTVNKNEVSLQDITNTEFDISASVESNHFIFPTTENTTSLTF